MTKLIKETPAILNANIHDFGKGKDNDPNNGSNGSGGSGSGSSGGSGQGGQGFGGTPMGQSPMGHTSPDVGVEDLPLINYNERAKDGKFGPALF